MALTSAFLFSFFSSSFLLATFSFSFCFSRASFNFFLLSSKYCWRKSSLFFFLSYSFFSCSLFSDICRSFSARSFSICSLSCFAWASLLFYFNASFYSSSFARFSFTMFLCDFDSWRLIIWRDCFFLDDWKTSFENVLGFPFYSSVSRRSIFLSVDWEYINLAFGTLYTLANVDFSLNSVIGEITWILD